ncbi:hypothetical protein HPB50_023565 [Hyalomma asiaticum]|uniref:Uncharacterized protein n=1 Tax=Hyalomma asiaticum TaxID=266040 RepID=A0ACB7T6H9_HYAAI|nr:hypothetical protein HPB50_023565 [Hyalomma asiaticum]
MRTSESVVTGYTPAYLCFERELLTPSTLFAPLLTPQTCPVSQGPSTHEYREEISKTIQAALDFAQAHQNKMKEVRERQYNQRRQPYEFAVVLHDCHTLSNANKGIAS